ncbi:ATP-binding protein [Actinoplanes sp. NPDC000266]
MSVRLQILGPMRVWRGDVELDAGPRQQALLLAVLLARAGRPVSTSELIDLIWGDDAPASALNVIHKYVGALRRLLEPAIPVRETGSYLQRRGNGYLIAAVPGMVDLVTFRQLVATARAALAQGRHDEALDDFAEALGLWQGHAGDGLAAGQPIFAALDEEFHAACADAATVAVSVHRPQRVLPALRLAASMAPFHEPVQAGLIAALGAAGLQAEALSVFHTVRAGLAGELGVDPGPLLRAAHLGVLKPPPDAPPDRDIEARAGFVGRAEELAVLRHVVDLSLGGRPALGIVEGEPGVGKTRLLRETAAEARERGALVVWASCLDGAGTPSMWPWEQSLPPIIESLPASRRNVWLTGELGAILGPRAAPAVPDRGAKFRLFEQVVTLVGEAAARQPLLLIADDLQWADDASLQLFGHLAARMPTGTAMIGALRNRAPAPGSDLSQVLAAAGRLSGHHRILLGPLSVTEVGELIRHETGRDPGADVAGRIHARTAGNPFFARELSRLPPDGVPATVRDVVRGRLADLDDDSHHLLRVAALIGRDVNVALLAGAAGVDVAGCLEHAEPLQALGLLESAPADPFSLRFPHDLVRESVIETIGRQLTARLHLRVADALEHAHPAGEAERLAHHLWSAGPLADPARTGEALARAGRRAATRHAYRAADRHLQSAARIARTAGLMELELSVLSLLTTVAMRYGEYSGSTFDLLDRAAHVARGLGREADAADFLFARLVGAYTSMDPRRGAWARELYEQGLASGDPVSQAYGWEAWGLHHWDTGDIDEAYRCFSGQGRAGADGVAKPPRNPVRRHVPEETPFDIPRFDYWPGWLALATALRGDPEAALTSIDRAFGAGEDHFTVSMWAYYYTKSASMAGNTAAVMHAVERWTACGAAGTAGPLFLYVRLDYLWARALGGDDPAGIAAEAEELVATALSDPPRFALPYYNGLVAEMWLAADMIDEAATALDRAERAMDEHGQRYAEGFVALVKARLSHARGEPADVVRAAAERARALSTERGARLFAHRAEQFLTTLA